jgi:hypothetical protein
LVPSGGAIRPRACQNCGTMTAPPHTARRARALHPYLAILVVLGAVLLLSSCAAGPNPVEGGEDAAGFWLGLWQGIIFPVTFVISLFTDNVSVYEVVNDGNWYDFGFFLGVLIILGGSGGGASRAGRRG